MLRFMPVYMRSFALRPMLNFVPTAHAEFDVLRIRLQGFGRRRGTSLTPDIYVDDPLSEVDADSKPKSPPPEKKEKLPKKKESPGKKQTLPTPTDVPVPEPWDIPPPDPKDPRPKSVP
jgi:hypothetical protein